MGKREGDIDIVDAKHANKRHVKIGHNMAYIKSVKIIRRNLDIFVSFPLSLGQGSILGKEEGIAEIMEISEFYS